MPPTKKKPAATKKPAAKKTTTKPPAAKKKPTAKKHVRKVSDKKDPAPIVETPEPEPKKVRQLKIRKRKRPSRVRINNTEQRPFKRIPIRAQFRHRDKLFIKLTMDRHSGLAMDADGNHFRFSEYENVEMIFNEKALQLN